jgi:vancomycin resistance protein YoaR
MPKRKSIPPEEKLELEDFQPEHSVPAWKQSSFWLWSGAALLGILLILGACFELIYANKIYPGVSADGLSLGGMTKAQAVKALNSRVDAFQGSVVSIEYNNSYLHIPVNSLNVSYDTSLAASLAYNFGRQGDLLNQLHAQARAFFGRVTGFSAYSYDPNTLVPFIGDIDSSVSAPVQDATLTFNNGEAQVTPSQTGTRLNLGLLAAQVNDSLAQTSSATIIAPVYQLDPALNTSTLEASVSQIDGDVSGPITLSYQDTTQTIDQSTIISWIEASVAPQFPFLQTLNLGSIYPQVPKAQLGLSQSAVSSYVQNLATSIDVPATNAGVDWQNNQAVITSPSKNGLALNQSQTVSQIIAALSATGSSRQITLNVSSSPAAVNENNLASLGITQQLSSGVTNYYWSPASRIHNFTLATKQFNDVLLSPGETFSFGKILGPAGTAQGYAMGYVILAHSEVPAPGGGICQVVTTAFRAALLAGLPITERTNHAFAISYYLWPYAIPGVDATIYYPELDLQFVNDTGHWILITANVDNSKNTLTFNFYGTKTKVGVIDGPYYVKPDGTQTSDPSYKNANESSHTVFYEKVEDLSGQVTKTYTFNSYYKPQSDFPPQSD